MFYSASYFSINGTPYLIMSRFFSSMSLYKWDRNDLKNVSLSDVICALQVLVGEQCDYQSDGEIVDMKDVILLLSEISR